MFDNFKEIILKNRTTLTALKADAFASKEDFTAWKNAVEKLRIATSIYVASNIEDAPEEVTKSCKDDVFASYKPVLAFFTNAALGEKLRCNYTDLNTLVAISGSRRKDNERPGEGKQYLPVSGITFRKSIEDFIADRFNGNIVTTADEIERIKKEKREKAKAEREAKKANKSTKIEKTTKAA